VQPGPFGGVVELVWVLGVQAGLEHKVHVRVLLLDRAERFAHGLPQRLSGLDRQQLVHAEEHRVGRGEAEPARAEPQVELVGETERVDGHPHVLSRLLHLAQQQRLHLQRVHRERDVGQWLGGDSRSAGLQRLGHWRWLLHHYGSGRDSRGRGIHGRSLRRGSNGSGGRGGRGGSGLAGGHGRSSCRRCRSCRRQLLRSSSSRRRRRSERLL
jgi:uncharacterized membrane protein YgcG